MPDGLTLYHHGSSACAAKVRFVLAEKQLSWESRYVDILAGEQFAPDFLEVNPKAVVPVLVHTIDGRDVIIRESSVICEYAEEAFPDRPRLMPSDPADRAAVRMWTKAVDEELHPACSALTYVTSHRHSILKAGAGDFESFLAGGGSEGRTARELKWRWIHEGLDAPGAADKILLYDGYVAQMDAALANREWLTGDQFTLADAALGPYLNRLAALAMEPMWQNGRRSNVDRWFKAIRARPSFNAGFIDWMPSDLTAEMRNNGAASWPEVARVLGL